MQLPMYCWAMLGTSLLVVLSTQVLAGTLILLSFELYQIQPKIISDQFLQTRFKYV